MSSPGDEVSRLVLGLGVAVIGAAAVRAALWARLALRLVLAPREHDALAVLTVGRRATGSEETAA